MFLNEKNINEIIGLSVISPLGNTGSVIQVIKEEDNHKKEVQNRVRYDTLMILWERGNKSIIFHMQADKIRVK